MLKPKSKFSGIKCDMKTQLLQQVVEDNPEGTGNNSRGWNALVDKTVEKGGPHWSGLSVRLAREKVREWVVDWKRQDTAAQKK